MHSILGATNQADAATQALQAVNHNLSNQSLATGKPAMDHRITGPSGHAPEKQEDPPLQLTHGIMQIQLGRVQRKRQPAAKPTQAGFLDRQKNLHARSEQLHGTPMMEHNVYVRLSKPLGHSASAVFGSNAMVICCKEEGQQPSVSIQRKDLVVEGLFTSRFLQNICFNPKPG